LSKISSTQEEKISTKTSLKSFNKGFIKWNQINFHILQLQNLSFLLTDYLAFLDFITEISEPITDFIGLAN